MIPRIPEGKLTQRELKERVEKSYKALGKSADYLIDALYDANEHFQKHGVDFMACLCKAEDNATHKGIKRSGINPEAYEIIDGLLKWIEYDADRIAAENGISLSGHHVANRLRGAKPALPRTYTALIDIYEKIDDKKFRKALDDCVKAELEEIPD